MYSLYPTIYTYQEVTQTGVYDIVIKYDPTLDCFLAAVSGPDYILLETSPEVFDAYDINGISDAERRFVEDLINKYKALARAAQSS